MKPFGSFKKTGKEPFVVRPGFEPRQTEPKSVVLPLHHSSISGEGGKNKGEVKASQKKSGPQPLKADVMLTGFVLPIQRIEDGLPMRRIVQEVGVGRIHKQSLQIVLADVVRVGFLDVE